MPIGSLNRSLPSRKNVRFSAKNSSFADRLTLDGSASTWPKSGLSVADSVNAGPRPYLRSSPTLRRQPNCLLSGSPASTGMRWNPPVTLGVRLVSVLADDLQHAGQAAYVKGLIERTG